MRSEPVAIAAGLQLAVRFELVMTDTRSLPLPVLTSLLTMSGFTRKQINRMTQHRLDDFEAFAHGLR